MFARWCITCGSDIDLATSSHRDRQLHRRVSPRPPPNLLTLSYQRADPATLVRDDTAIQSESRLGEHGRDQPAVQRLQLLSITACTETVIEPGAPVRKYLNVSTLQIIGTRHLAAAVTRCWTSLTASSALLVALTCEFS
ncbi:hypothetical protein J6590_017094 [Homalodisca vitripennis]|nr:hypothetical protein J6590_017094 [Homalodisca vitripennis]